MKHERRVGLFTCRDQRNVSIEIFFVDRSKFPWKREAGKHFSFQIVKRFIRVMSRIYTVQTQTTAVLHFYDDRTREIQKYLTSHLEMTPRRQLFEEHEKSPLRPEDSKATSTGSGTVVSKSISKSELHTISEFRRQNARECMSHQNQQRLKRAKEMEESHLHNYSNRFFQPERCKLNICDVEENPNRKVHSTKDNCVADFHKFPRLKTVRFAPENSLALVNQKFKC